MNCPDQPYDVYYRVKAFYLTTPSVEPATRRP
jgi:hypothetical protein